MQIFLTGVTGWVGTAVARELIAAGHQVRGLARSLEKAAAMANAGVSIVPGDLAAADLLRAEATAADAVVHTAFGHDFSRFQAASDEDVRAIEAMGAALEGTDKPILVTSGVTLVAPGRIVTEADRQSANHATPRRSEVAALALRDKGVRAVILRLCPTVHGDGDHGFMRRLITLARDTGVSAYVGDGSNRWPAVHRLDAAALYRIALEQIDSATVYHAVGEIGVPFGQVAETIGRKLGLPIESRPPEHFGFLGQMVAADMPASSERTRIATGWLPKHPGLIADLGLDSYYRI